MGAETTMAEDPAIAPKRELSEGEMSFGDHLEELRSRLVRALAATFVAFFVLFANGREVMAIVVEPYRSVARDLHIASALNNFAPGSAFFGTMKVSLLAAVIVSAPVWIWQGWAFISVGLYKNERTWVYRFGPLMVGLFCAGVFFGYRVLIPTGLQYLLSFQDPALMQSWIGLGEYLAFFLTLTFVLGLVFQLPIVLALLTRLEILEMETLRTKRRHFILGSFIASALLTPPDPITQVLMAIPLVFLYELGVLFSWIALGKNRPPIDGATWRRRGLIALVVAILVVLLQDKARSLYRERMVKRDIVSTQADDDERMPYLAVFDRCDFVDFKPTLAFKLERTEMRQTEEEGGAKSRELWLVGGKEKALPLEILFRDSRIVVTDAGEDGTARLLIQPATQSMEIKCAETVSGGRMLPVCFAALGSADDEDFPRIESLLTGLIGQRPEGLQAGAEREEATEAWSQWREANPDWVWTRER